MNSWVGEVGSTAISFEAQMKDHDEHAGSSSTWIRGVDASDIVWQHRRHLADNPTALAFVWSNADKYECRP